MTPGFLLGVSGLGLILGSVASWRRPRLNILGVVVAASAAAGAAAWVLAGGGSWEWRSELLLAGEALHLRLDAVSAFFLLLLAVLGAVGAVYASGYWKDADHPLSAARGRMWWNALLMAMGLVLVSSNGLHFLVAWEAFTISAYFLITLERHKREARTAGWLYLAASHAGALCLVAFFAALASRTGSWDLGPLRDRPDLAPLFWVALGGFALKAGVFPLHVWLPSAHSAAPSHVSAILSGVALKMGIYGLVRFSGWLPVGGAVAWVLVAAGVASAVLGVAFALGQHDLKRLLAYHSVENIGIILIGLGFGIVAASGGGGAWGLLAFTGGLLHVWNHGLFKALLFLGAGSVVHATGTREMSRLGGLWRGMPWTASTFVLGSIAISGLPPLNGFVSEWLVYLGLFQATVSRGSAALVAVPSAVLLAVTGALALACFVKVCGVVFLGTPRSRAAAQAHESGGAMRVPLLVLSAACVAVGLVPWLLWPALAAVADSWQPGLWPSRLAPTSLQVVGQGNLMLLALGAAAILMLRRRMHHNGWVRGVTWDCGYAAPAARMQYTAGSFAAIITGWFQWILRSRRHVDPVSGVFPSKATHEEHTPETILEDVVLPLAGRVLRFSTAVRRLQHGRVQAYILYLLLGMAALALLAVMGGSE